MADTTTQQFLEIDKIKATGEQVFKILITLVVFH